MKNVIPIKGNRRGSADELGPVILICPDPIDARLVTDLGEGNVVGMSAHDAARDGKVLAGRHVLIWPGRESPVDMTREAIAAGAARVELVALEDLAESYPDDKPRRVVDWADAVRTQFSRPASPSDLTGLPRRVVAVAGVGVTWKPLRPMPDVSLAPVAPFDMAMLPESIRAWVQDITERMQCPPDFAGATALAALGIVIGRRVGVRPKQHDDWTEYANLWVCIIGRPGVMKSPAMKAVLAPLERLQARANESHERAMAEFQMEEKVYQIRAERADAKLRQAVLSNSATAAAGVALPAPSKPKLRRFLVNDSTPESLLDICVENPEGVGVYRDELVPMLKGMERPGHETERGFYLTGWNGNDPYTVDRIGRGRNLRADAVCLSVIGSTQPGRAHSYLREAIDGGTADDGLIQRFGVLVWPDISPTWENIDRYANTEQKNEAFKVFERLVVADPVLDWNAEVVMGYDGLPEKGTPPYLRLSDDARMMFEAWRHEWEPLIRSDQLHPALQAHFSKYRKLIPAIALILHLAASGRGAVSADAMMLALRWCEYLKSHALRAYGSSLVTPLDRARALLEKIEAGKLPRTPFALRVIQRAEWSLLKNKEQINEAIDVLAQHGYLAVVSEPTTGSAGRPREPRYIIRPEVFD